MKIVLKIAAVLTWFNIVFWGLVVIVAALGILARADPMSIILLVLLSSIPLNSFAAIRLHSSIRYPQIPLSHQTPVGIRFVGFIALFVGITMLFTGMAMVNDPKMVASGLAEQMEQYPVYYQQSPWLKTLPYQFWSWFGGCLLALGLFIALNVILNLRLLRWYYLVRKSDAS